MANLGPFADRFILHDSDMRRDLFDHENGTAFDVGTSIHMLHHCNLAYYYEDEILSTLNKNGYDGVFFSAKKDSYDPQGYMAYNDDAVILTMRGTEPMNLNDWLTDLAFKKVQLTGWGGAHEGFFTSVHLLFSQIEEALEKHYKGKPNKLFVTGHSLGAAMAIILSCRLYEECRYNPSSIYLFGSPRALETGSAVDRYNAILGQRTYRIVNNNDVVTNVPLELMGFSHIGTFKYLNTEGRLLTDPSWWYLKLDGIWGSVTDIGDLDLDAIEDHCTIHYLNQLESNL